MSNPFFWLEGDRWSEFVGVERIGVNGAEFTAKYPDVNGRVAVTAADLEVYFDSFYPLLLISSDDPATIREILLRWQRGHNIISEAVGGGQLDEWSPEVKRILEKFEVGVAACETKLLATGQL